MKIRQGFVANSSSSSFLLGLDRKPRSIRELQKLLFGDMEYLQYYENSYKTKDVATIIFKDLRKARPLSTRRIAGVVDSGYFPGYPDRWNRKRPSDRLKRQFHEQFPEYDDKYWEMDKITNKMAKQLAEKIHLVNKKERAEDEAELEKAVDKYMRQSVLPKFKGKKVYTLEYADDTHGHIEHGDVFSNIPHIRISHH